MASRQPSNPFASPSVHSVSTVYARGAKWLGKYLAEALRLGVLLEAESWEVDTCAENLGPGKNADTTNTVNLHFHVWITVWVPKVGQVRSPCGVLGIALDNDSILVQRIGQREGGLGLLPRVQVVGLLSTQPVGEGTPNI